MPSISSSETGQTLRAGAALASEAGGDDRANGAASATAASGGTPRSSVPDPAGARTLELLVSDFARVLGCEVALVCELDGDSGAQVVCASGIDRPVAITISRRGGRRRSAAARTAGAVSLAGRSPTSTRPSRPSTPIATPTCSAPPTRAGSGSGLVWAKARRFPGWPASNLAVTTSTESDETISSLPTRRLRELTNPQAKRERAAG
jgi:hypothetical protein